MTDYVRLLEANNAIQTIGDDTYWLCVTRTVQESKLFPVPSYMLLSYLCCFYRYPELLRKIEGSMKAEEIGDRARAMGGNMAPMNATSTPVMCASRSSASSAGTSLSMFMPNCTPAAMATGCTPPRRPSSRRCRNTASSSPARAVAH